MKFKYISNQVMTAMAIIVVAFIVASFIFSTATSVVIALSMFGAFILQGYRKIESDPPHKSILVIKGPRQKTYSEDKDADVTEYIDEGWNFFPFYPYWTDFIPVKVERENFQVTVETITPDRAPVRITVEVSVRPIPYRLIEYKDSKGLEGVTKQFSGEISDQVRSWAEGNEEGPKTWHEVYQSKAEAVYVLIKRIAGSKKTEVFGKIEDYAQSIPTSIWLKFFSHPRPKGEKWPNEKFFKNEEKWAENDWEKVRKVYDPLTDDQKEELREAVKERRKVISKLQAGEAKIDLIDVGVFLERLNISNVEGLGETKKAAELEAKEEQERQGEELETTHIQKLIKMYMELGYDREQALEIIQTERGKVNKEISEKKINISQESRQVVEKLGEKIIEKVFSGGNNND